MQTVDDFRGGVERPVRRRLPPDEGGDGDRSRMFWIRPGSLSQAFHFVLPKSTPTYRFSGVVFTGALGSQCVPKHPNVR